MDTLAGPNGKFMHTNDWPFAVQKGNLKGDAHLQTSMTGPSKTI